MRLIVIAIFAAPFVFAFKEVPDHQRCIIGGFGKYMHACGAGSHFIARFIDRATIVDLEIDLPGWQGMNGVDIVAKITRKQYGVEAA